MVPAQLERTAPAGISRVADGQRQLGAGAGLVAGRRSRRVDDLCEARLLDAGVEQPANEPDPVSCGAATRGVSRVQQEHGAALDLASPARRPRRPRPSRPRSGWRSSQKRLRPGARASVAARVQSPSATTTALQPMPGASM